MIGRLGRRSGAAVTLLTALLAVGPASPADAAPVIGISAPRETPALDSSTVSLRGTVDVDSTLTSTLSTLQSVTLSVAGKTIPVPDCDGTRSCTFDTAVNLPLNGQYTLTVTASQTGLVSGSDARQSRTFGVAAPPASPVLDSPRVNDARNVELSWSRNTEGDMLYYAVFRKDPGGSGFKQVGKVSQPGSGSKVAFTDTTTSAFTGGDYAYQVYAVRKGVGDAEVASGASAGRTASVPAPPTSTSSTTPPPPGSPAALAAAAGPTTTVKPGAAAGVDLSSFLSARSQVTPVAPITIPEPPDTGFKGTLPFGARPGDDVEEGGAEATPPARRSTSVITSIRDGRPLVPVAGGLVLLLLALHMRLLNRKIKAADDADLPVAAAAAPPPAVTPLPLLPDPDPDPEPEPDPEPDLYAVGRDIDLDEEWAPPAPLPAAPIDVDVEPVPAAGPVFDIDFELEGDPWAAAPDEEVVDPDEIEVFEVVSPTRRRLARAGSR